MNVLLHKIKCQREARGSDVEQMVRCRNERQITVHVWLNEYFEIMIIAKKRIKLYKMLKSSVIFLKNVVCYKSDSSGAGIVI